MDSIIEIEHHIYALDAIAHFTQEMSGPCRIDARPDTEPSGEETHREVRHVRHSSLLPKNPLRISITEPIPYRKCPRPEPQKENPKKVKTIRGSGEKDSPRPTRQQHHPHHRDDERPSRVSRSRSRRSADGRRVVVDKRRAACFVDSVDGHGHEGGVERGCGGFNLE